MLFIGRLRSMQRGHLRIYMTMPFIYAMVVPIFFLDICTRIYQAMCFPAYGIALVDRKKYVRPGHRGRLIHPFDRLNCRYCGYANGVAAYVREVMAATERYWCPIRHIKMKGFVEPAHHATFVKDGAVKELREKLEEG